MTLSTLSTLLFGAAVVNGAFDCEIQWSQSAKPENMMGSSAETLAMLQEDGWEVRAFTKESPLADEVEVPLSEFQQWNGDDEYSPGFYAQGDTRIALKHFFTRPYRQVRLVVDNGSLQPGQDNDVIDLSYSSPTGFRGQGTQVSQAFPTGTLVINDVLIGDYIEISEYNSMMVFKELSFDCTDTFVPEMPPQPDGPVVEVTMIPECENPEETMSIPVVWAPTECQIDPMSEGQESLILECVKDGSLWVRIFPNNNCGGNAEQNLFLRHDQEVISNEFDGEERHCHKFLLPTIIREACELDQPTPMPVPAPVRAAVHCQSTGDPHFQAFFYGYNPNIVMRSHSERYFDFQNFGEFQLWGTDGLDIQVRHGSRLDMVTTTVSTNNAMVIAGEKTCGIKYEIYGVNGYWLRAWIPGQATPVQFFGKANVLQGLATFPAFQNCATSQININTATSRVQFDFEGIVFKAQLSVYGLDLYLTVQGAQYLPTDTGICPKTKGWNDELNCSSMFTMYPGDDCPSLPRDINPPISLDNCDQALREEAEKRCQACPNEVLPEECVLEVCAVGDIRAAADLLELCSINEVPIAPRPAVSCQCTGDPHCVWFDRVRQDFHSRGEFIFYENKGVTVMTRQGYRPDIKARDDISTNHGVAISGKWTCGMTYEFFYDKTHGNADPHTSPVSMLKVSKGNDVSTHEGIADILTELGNAQKHSCVEIANRGNVIEFVLNNDAMRVRVQQEWWGINVWVDVTGPFNLPSDGGMCTRKSFEPVSCDDTIFTDFPEGSCPNIVIVDNGPPAKPEIPACSPALLEEAREVCGACPQIVEMDECLFETCTIGKISAAHELVKACQGTPVAPKPEPTPAPVPDVYCSTYNDPHMRYFDATSGDNMNRGNFLFYETDVLEIQTRHGPYLTLAETHPSYNTVSTNNAMAFTGSWICGALVEVDAYKPTTVGSKLGEGKMRITKDGKTHRFDSIAEMVDNERKINNLVCDGFSVDLTYAGGKYGPIFILEKDGYNMRWQNRPHGINMWITVEGVKYLSSDAGMCTWRGDYQAPLDCDKILFTEFPESDSCAEEKNKDQVIPVPERPACNADLLREATEICNSCPDIVAPQECVTETCLLGAIEFAQEQVVACGLKPPAKNTCGSRGVIRKKGDKVSVPKVETACECREACKAAGGLEWAFKGKKNKCGCWTGSEKMIVRDGDVTNTNKRVVGKINGSVVDVQSV